MASVIDPYKRRLLLNATEIQELTGWPDAMVQDYLNILQEILDLVNSLNELIVQPRQFIQLETDDDPPELPDVADPAVAVTIRCRRSDDRYEDYVYEP